MWCPKCRNEYINGVTTCVDCGCDLVEELPEEIDENEPVAIGSLAKEETAAKLVSYLNRAGLLSCAVRPQPGNERGKSLPTILSSPEKNWFISISSLMV